MAGPRSAGLHSGCCRRRGGRRAAGRGLGSRRRPRAGAGRLVLITRRGGLGGGCRRAAGSHAGAAPTRAGPAAAPPRPCGRPAEVAGPRRPRLCLDSPASAPISARLSGSPAPAPSPPVSPASPRNEARVGALGQPAPLAPVLGEGWGLQDRQTSGPTDPAPRTGAARHYGNACQGLDHLALPPFGGHSPRGGAEGRPQPFRLRRHSVPGQGSVLNCPPAPQKG